MALVTRFDDSREITSNEQIVPFSALQENPKAVQENPKLENFTVVEAFIKNQNAFGELQERLRQSGTRSDFTLKGCARDLAQWNELTAQYETLNKEMNNLHISKEKISYKEEETLLKNYPWVLKKTSSYVRDNFDDSDLINKINSLTPDQCIEFLIDCQRHLHREFLVENQILFTSDYETKDLLSPNIYHALAIPDGKYTYGRILYGARLAVEKLGTQRISNEKIIEALSEPGNLNFTLLHFPHIFKSAIPLLLQLSFTEFSKVVSIENSDCNTALNTFAGNSIKAFPLLQQKVRQAAADPANTPYFGKIDNETYYIPNLANPDKKYKLYPIVTGKV